MLLFAKCGCKGTKKMRNEKGEMRNISYFCSKFNVFMKKYTRFLGLFLILLGALCFVAARFSALDHSNWPLLVGLLLIIIGIIVHIRQLS